MRAATAASILVQPVAFANPYLADANRDADHAGPSTDYADHAIHGADHVNHAGLDANHANHDQPATDNDGQRHHGCRDLSSDVPVRRDPGADSQADIQPYRHTDGHHTDGSGEVAGKDAIGHADAGPHHREGQPIRVGRPDHDPQGLRQRHANYLENHLVSQAETQADAQAETQAHTQAHPHCEAHAHRYAHRNPGRHQLAQRCQDGAARRAGQPLRRGRARAGEQRTGTFGPVERERLGDGREHFRCRHPAAGVSRERRVTKLQLRLRQR
jgi:hypothetical protein